MRNRIKNCFYTGLIAVLPVALTLYFISWGGAVIIGIIGSSPAVGWLTDYLFQLESITTRQEAEAYIRAGVYLLVMGGMLLGILLVGAGLKLMIGRRAADALDRLFTRIPVIKSVYTTVSQITAMITSDKSKSYQKVVVVEYPREGVYSLGFLTSDENRYFDKTAQGRDLVNVFIPTSPNPTSGMFVMVEREEVRVVDMRVEEAVKLIISGGAILPDRGRGEKERVQQ